MRTRRDVFYFLSDPTRRAIISLIALQAMTPNAVAAHFAITRQAVSKHLQILNDCELITQQRLGREIHYQLKVEKMKEIDRWLEQFRGVWERKFNQLDEVFDTLKKPKNET